MLIDAVLPLYERRGYRSRRPIASYLTVRIGGSGYRRSSERVRTTVPIRHGTRVGDSLRGAGRRDRTYRRVARIGTRRFPLRGPIWTDGLRRLPPPARRAAP